MKIKLGKMVKSRLKPKGLCITFVSMITQNLTVILWLLAMFGGFSSCQMAKCGATKAIFLRNYDALFNEINALDDEDSDQAWSRHDRKFRNYVEDCYDAFEEEMSDREKREFWIKSLKYYASRYGEDMIDELSKDDVANTHVRENIKEVLEDTGKNLEDFLENSVDKLEVLFEDIGNDIEKWAERIKEMIEE